MLLDIGGFAKGGEGSGHQLVIMLKILRRASSRSNKEEQSQKLNALKRAFNFKSGWEDFTSVFAAARWAVRGGELISILDSSALSAEA
jgi:hypothetical protein